MNKFSAFLVIICVLILNNSFSAQKANSYHQILASTDIVAISYYLKNLKNGNPQQKAVQNRLKQLKNGSWKSEPRLLLSAATSESPKNEEKPEFKNLIKESAEAHDRKAVKLLNHIFNTNKKSSESVLLVKNESPCDIILRLKGKEEYHLAVPSKGENFINLTKDSYLIIAKICNSDYSKTKDLNQSQVITFRHSAQN